MANVSPYYTYLTELLKTMLEKGASDLFLTVGSPPALKVNGELTPFNAKPITREQAEEIIRSAMNEKQQAEFVDTRECNFAISLDGIGRFRVNTYVQRGSPGLVARHINTNVPTIDSLGLPPLLGKLVQTKRVDGRHVLAWSAPLAGQTGAGKARLDPDGRRHRLRQIHQSGGAGEPPQRTFARPHHHHRRPHRVHAPAQEEPDHATRGGSRYR